MRERRRPGSPAADAVEAVAAGDEVAVEHVLLAVLASADARARAVDAVERDVLGFVDRLQRRAPSRASIRSRVTSVWP